MILAKKDIARIKRALDTANKAQVAAQQAQNELAKLISDITGVRGSVDYLPGDGMKFTGNMIEYNYIPMSIAIDNLLEMAENGQDISRELIAENSFL